MVAVAFRSCSGRKKIGAHQGKCAPWADRRRGTLIVEIFRIEMIFDGIANSPGNHDRDERHALPVERKHPGARPFQPLLGNHRFVDAYVELGLRNAGRLTGKDR